jgi:hypothetical protein
MMSTATLASEVLRCPILLTAEKSEFVAGGLPALVCLALGLAIVAGQEELLPVFIGGCVVGGPQ